jgi:L-lactate dehydrogenase (cytochrome)
MLALGAKGVLLGRAYIYALAAGGEAGVARLLELVAAEMRVAMALSGVTSIEDISSEALVSQG